MPPTCSPSRSSTTALPTGSVPTLTAKRDCPCTACAPNQEASTPAACNVVLPGVCPKTTGILEAWLDECCEKGTGRRLRSLANTRRCSVSKISEAASIWMGDFGVLITLHAAPVVFASCSVIRFWRTISSAGKGTSASPWPLINSLGVGVIAASNMSFKRTSNVLVELDEGGRVYLSLRNAFCTRTLSGSAISID